MAAGKLDRARAMLAGYSAPTDGGEHDWLVHQLRLARARLDVEEGKYAAALTRLEGWTAGGDGAAQCAHLKGVACEGLGRWGDAARAYRQAYDLEPSAERLVAWLDTLVLDGRANEAAEILESERSGFPGQVAVHVAAARLYAHLGEATAAVGELRAALLLEPGSLGLRRRLGQACMAAGDYRTAISTWRELVGSSTDERQRHCFRRQLATCLLATDQYGAAADTYRTMALLRSDDADVQVGLATAALGEGRSAEALQAASRALSLDPGHVEARLVGAVSYARLGQRPRALAELSRLRAEDRERPLVRELQARWQPGSADE